MRKTMMMLQSLLTLTLLSVTSAASPCSYRSSLAAWGLPSSSLLHLRGGSDGNGDGNGDDSSLEAVKASVLASALASIDDLTQQTLNGVVVEDFGGQAEIICNEALQEFSAQAPAAVSGAVYDRVLESLEAALDAPLHVLYLKQLAILREAALERFRSGSATYQSMLQADSQFVAAAEAATRPGSDWDYANERSFLQTVMNLTAESGRTAQETKLTAAQQQQTAMSFLQSQQQMIQQLQMQLYGQSSPWNVGVAYRIPDTNFNLQGSYQQGRANVQLSCVPDEYAPFLGPNGFTNGVGPGNLGLSLNLSI